jgi:hypothetical protein
MSEPPEYGDPKIPPYPYPYPDLGEPRYEAPEEAPPAPGPPPEPEYYRGPPAQAYQRGSSVYGAPPRKRHRLTAVLIAGAVAGALALGGLGVAGYLLYRRDAAPEAAAATWLRGWQHNDPDAAYAVLCSAQRDQISQAKFRTYSYRPRKVADFVVHDVRRGPAAHPWTRVDYTVMFTDGTETAGILEMVDQNGWKVCRF